MTPKERQEHLRKLQEAAAGNFKELSKKQIDFAIQEIDKTRQQLTDALAKNAGKDGTFKKDRIAALMKDLDTIEKRIRENGLNSMETIIKETAKMAAAERAAELGDILGTAGAIGVRFDRIPENVFRYVATRFSEDGMVLSDRVWQVSGQLRDELGSAIRSGILRGQGLNEMIAAVRQVYQNDTWKIKRLALTESATAYRTADMHVAQQSKWVSAVKIHKGKADRPEHACSKLAAQNNHGMGAGIYPAESAEVVNPHPNCTSWLEFVLDDEAIQKSKAAEGK